MTLPATPRLALTKIASNDQVSAYPPVEDGNMAVLDNAVTYSQGSLAHMPPAGLAGRRYYATDVGTELYDTGTQWIPTGAPSPIGCIVQYAGASDPVDVGGGVSWMVCNGRYLSRTTYATLFNRVGSTYGSGDVPALFALPDLRGRVLVGAGQGDGLSGRALGRGSWGGEESHTLSAGSMPTHNHTDTGHSHNDAGHSQQPPPGFAFVISATGVAIGFDNNSGAFGHIQGNGPFSIVQAVQGFANIQTGHAQIETTGGGAAHNNMQPYATMNHIIRVR